MFIPLSVESDKFESEWEKNSVDGLPRRCPARDGDSIIGHDRRHMMSAVPPTIIR